MSQRVDVDSKAIMMRTKKKQHDKKKTKTKTKIIKTYHFLLCQNMLPWPDAVVDDVDIVVVEMGP